MGYDITSLGQLPPTLYENYPNLVRSYYRYDGITSNVSRGANVFRESIQVGDTTLIAMFGFKVTEGDAVHAFDGPGKVVLSEQAAKKYFGNEPAVGSLLSIENFSGGRRDFEVTAVLAPMERNSVTQLLGDFSNEVFLSIHDLDFFGRDMDWENNTIPAYIELQPGVSPDALIQPIRRLVASHTSERIAENYSPVLVPLSKVYLRANNGVIQRMLYLLSAMAAFILLMALINFVNIAVSRASTRLREIGVRKTMGGLRRQLMVQFLSESWLVVLLSAILALGVYELLRPFAMSVLAKPLPTLWELPLMLWPLVLLFVFLIGLLAGIYPALLLSAIPVSRAVKGKWAAEHERKWLRSTLVGIQFALAVLALSGTLVISRQVDLFFGNQLGYSTDHVLTAQLPRDWTSGGVAKMEGIRRQFEQLPEVLSASISYEVMDGRNGGTIRIYREGQDESTAVASQYLSTDENFAQTYGLPLLAGRYLQQENGQADSISIVLNESQLSSLGWKTPQEALGQTVQIEEDPRRFHVSGIVKDVHFGSMHKKIEASSFVHLNTFHLYRFLSLKLKPGHPASQIDALRSTWTSLLPGAAFEYRFMDEALQSLYRTEIQLKKASAFGTGFSLLMVSLALIGMVALSVQRRMREVGIRKIMGASGLQVIRLFLTEFLPVLLIASVVSIPAGWWLMQGWLDDFAYQVPLNLLSFVGSAVGLIMLSLLVIGLQTLRVGQKKPSDILRSSAGE